MESFFLSLFLIIPIKKEDVNGDNLVALPPPLSLSHLRIISHPIPFPPPLPPPLMRPPPSLSSPKIFPKAIQSSWCILLRTKFLFKWIEQREAERKEKKERKMKRGWWWTRQDEGGEEEEEEEEEELKWSKFVNCEDNDKEGQELTHN